MVTDRVTGRCGFGVRDGKSSRAAERGVRRLNSTVAECDRLGDGRADRSSKHTLHGVNAQVATDPSGKILWLSPALPGRTHDLTAARTRQILRICERQGTPQTRRHGLPVPGHWGTTT
ncbi:hypothetical protein Srut_03040 [Streptomyces rutgersensis]|nr:hypothetical protein Srut_03040 [Streptomyces rutgersensis]